MAKKYQNFQFFAPAASIGTTGGYFHTDTIIFQLKAYHLDKKYSKIFARALYPLCTLHRYGLWTISDNIF